jgi:hypothetical protein
MQPSTTSKASIIIAFIFATLFSSNSFSADKKPQQALRIVDVNALEYGDAWNGLNGTSKAKLLYQNDSGAFMMYIDFDPGWDAVNKARHFHDFHEWGYVLSGDFMLYEFVNPMQQKGSLYPMRPGTWMSRPPFSIHGNRPDAMEHQKITTPSIQLAFIEGGKNYSLDPNNKWYSEEWKNVKQFTQPRFQNTATTQLMEWEDAHDLPGASVKWLTDDAEDGFRSRLIYVPAGWSHPDGPTKTYFEKAQRLVYVLFGDLSISSATESGIDEVATVHKDYFVEQPPMSFWGWGEGPLTEKGAMWLEVTYADATTQRGVGPIEAQKTITR